jgi:aldehyde dehydrogenase (NAD+)
VQESIAPAFIEAVKARFVGATSALGGDPQDPTTMLGPIVDEIQSNRVMSYINIGKEEGAPLVGGAQRGAKGFFIEPTIFLNPAKESRVYKEEIFGPVLSILTFKPEEEAIALANDTKTGISCEYQSVSIRSSKLTCKIKARFIHQISIELSESQQRSMPAQFR